ncbi:BCLAF1 and THRAP3 family member 3 isoform X2 [Thalassophryne amazonica]|uniref:BCLAF1 and THRAP3 family member 3 isoform X2 n=1 Tax=Thalassophryne amazonica TaxID=390379 RepID=UPI001471CF22|nr:BCLAF1 and THRAP3 family member 3 isoform X2 [Thalassophryne amazonica]XP_034023844.1 BCLAF1 and THRAP3 family member 3 isoform X2 [Thalassophryne amazonica]
MPQQRSGSPNYRSPRRQPLPCDQSDSHPYTRLAEHDMLLDRSHQPRVDHEEYRDIYPEGLRRSPSFSDGRHFGHQSHPVPEDLYRRRTPPFRDMMGYEEGMRDRFQHFENRGRSPHSPPRVARERLPSMPQSLTDHPQIVSEMDWRRENKGRDRGRSKDLSPRPMLDDQRSISGRDRGRRDEQDLNRNGRRDNSQRQRNYPVKRHRRKMDDGSPIRYGIEADFEERDSQERPRDAFGDGTPEHSGPSVYEYDHDRNVGGQPQCQQFDDRSGRSSGFGQNRSPFPIDPLKEHHFRRSDGRMDDQEGARPHSSHDNRRAAAYENRGSPVHRGRTNLQQTDRSHPLSHLTNYRRDGPHPKRRANYDGRTGTGPSRSHSSSQQTHKGYPNHPHEQQIQERAEDFYKDSVNVVPDWTEAGGFQKWSHDRPGSQDRQLLKGDLDPKMPRQRVRGWHPQQANDMTVVTKETLTIKVDMSRPVMQNSQLCYSSDRQLSLDLVNVGRQRLDFLPMLQHSGTYHETPTHTGTFAQEIITLVHQVKDQYFRDSGVSLNERFAAPQKGGYSDGDLEELTLDERFSSKRGFTFHNNTLIDDEPLFSSVGPMQQVMKQQPLRGPGDLRHDLERRRQERLEGVKVTIPGNSMSQRPLSPLSKQCEEYIEVEAAQMEGGFSRWSGQQKTRRGGRMGPRRGANYRHNMRFQHRNNVGHSHTGPMARGNNRNSATGINW